MPNESASHPGSGAEAWNRGSDVGHPGPEPDEGRPGRVPDGYPPGAQPGEGHPDRVPDDRRRGEVRPVRGAEPDARPEPTNTGCCRPGAPWGQASGRVRPVWGLREPPAQQTRREPPVLRSRSPEPAPRGEQEPEWDATAPEQPGVPERTAGVPTAGVPTAGGCSPRWEREPMPPERTGPEPPDVPRASGPDGVLHQAWRTVPAWATRSMRLRLEPSPMLRTGRTHEVDAQPAPRRWMMLTSRTRPAL